MERLVLYTDGGVVNNGHADSFGTYAFLLKPKTMNIHKPLSVHTAKYDNTTNNRMEMMAAIKAIKWCSETYRDIGMQVVSDSIYLVDGMTNASYLDRWINNGWVTSGKTPVKNKDLWTILNNLRWHNSLIWTHIRGHGKCNDITHREYNDICDAACRFTYELESGYEYSLSYDMKTKKFDVISKTIIV